MRPQGHKEDGGEEAISVDVLVAPSRERLADIWRSVQARSHCSFFLSWEWVGCWLRESGVAPVLLCAMRGGVPAGVAILCRPGEGARQDRLIPSLHLTSAGGGAFDSPFVEYNGFVVAEEDIAAGEALAARIAAMPARRRAGEGAAWGRLGLPGVGAATRDLLARTAGLRLRLVAARPSPFIDLAAIRSGGGNYLDGRGTNTRQQIRRSIRLFEAEGPLTLTAAASLDEAVVVFDELKALHQASWVARGKPGAFAVPFFERFHRALIADAWPAGKIDLLRLRAGSRTIGCLYNFVHDGRAYAYQSGFARERDARLKPGMVSHSLAAERYLAAGLERYLLLAGESRYKTSLATGSDTLYWLEATRPGAAGWFGALADASGRALARVIGRLAARRRVASG